MQYKTLFILCLTCNVVNAQVVSITQSNVPYVQNFDSLEYAGTSGTLMPQGWYFVSASGNSYSISHGSSVTGAVYSYGGSNQPERALGTLATNTNPNPMIGASIKNNTGSAITSIYLSFWVEQWRKGNSSFPDSSEFSVSMNATSIDDAVALWNKIPELNLRTVNTTASTGALDGNSAENREYISYLVNLAFPVPDGITIWIRWVDVNIPDSDDGLAIDDFMLIANPVAATLMPVQNLAATLSAGFDSATIAWDLPANFDSVTQKVLVFVKEGTAITQGTPSQNSAFYFADPDFSGTGTPYEHDADAKNIYNGTGSEVILTGFNADSTYYILAYVVDNVFNNYSSAATTIMSNVAAINISQLTPASICPGDSLWVYYDITGNFDQGNEFIVQLSDADGSFNVPVLLDTIISVIAGMIQVNIPKNFDAGPGYNIRIVSTQPQIISNSSNLTIHPVPIAEILTPDTSMCQGDSVLLNANTGSGFDYQWLLDNNPVQGGVNAELYANEEGIYSVKVANLFGCKDTSSSIYLSVHPLPEVPEITESGNVLYSSAAYHYQWFYEDSLLAGDTLQSYTPFAEGIHHVLVTDSNGCSRVSQAYNFISTGMENSLLPGVKAFPNPVTGKLEIHATGIIDVVIITGITGKEILHIPDVNSNNYILDVSMMDEGHYFLTVISGNNRITRKILKE